MDVNPYEIEYDQESIRCNGFLSGHFDVALEKEIHPVKLQLWGISKCCWEKPKTSIFKKSKKFIGTKENLYAEHNLTFYEDLDDKRRYYFRAKLPANIPPTWEGLYGFNKCMIKIIIDYPNQQKTFESEVYVLPYRDLRLEKHLLNESREDVNHSFNFTILNLGWINISIWLPLSGISAGQALPLLCTIKNQSNVIFNAITFIFNMNEIYLCNSPVAKKTKVYELVIIKRKSDIGHGCYEFYCLIETEKKWFPTSQCPKESCCTITYDLKVRVSSPEAHDKMIIETDPVPIIIGTVPLLEWSGKRITEEITKETFNRKMLTGEDMDETDSELFSEPEYM